MGREVGGDAGEVLGDYGGEGLEGGPVGGGIISIDVVVLRELGFCDGEKEEGGDKVNFDLIQKKYINNRVPA